MGSPQRTTPASDRPDFRKPSGGETVERFVRGELSRLGLPFGETTEIGAQAAAVNRLEGVEFDPVLEGLARLKEAGVVGLAEAFALLQRHVGEREAG